MADIKTSSKGAAPANQKAVGKEAKAAASPPVDDNKAEAQRMFRFDASTVLIAALIMAMLIAAPPTFIVFAIGMAPTFVGNLTQLERNSYRSIALASLNFAGVLPYLLDLWLAGHKMEIALRIVTDVYALFVMYGAAALAVMVFWAAPQISASFLTVLGIRRLNLLRREQEALILEWGPEVGNPDTSVKD
jgi:hypothetical protein